MMKHLSIFILFFALACDDLYSQSPWNQSRGEGFFKLTQTVNVSDNFYDAGGDLISIKTAGVYITSLYGEYGISNRLTVFAYFPFFFRNTLNAQRQINSGITVPGEESNSIGDSNLGLAYGFIQQGPFVVNASLALGLPTGETAGGRSGILQSGDGEFNQLVKLNAGYSFPGTPVYAAASAGFNNRTNNFSDDIRFSVEAGITFWQKLTASVRVNRLVSLENGSAEPQQTGIFANNLEYLSIRPKINYRFYKSWGLSAAFETTTSGQNVLADPSQSLGIFYDF